MTWAVALDRRCGRVPTKILLSFSLSQELYIVGLFFTPSTGTRTVSLELCVRKGRRGAGRDVGGGGPVPAHRRVLAPDYLYPTGRRQRGLLLVEVHLRFANVYSRPLIYVSAAPVWSCKVVYPRGGTARPVSRSCTAVSSTDRVESLGF